MRVDRAADLDRQTADVRQRHRAQPPLVGVEPQRERRAERVPQPVVVAEHHRLGPAVVPEVNITVAGSSDDTLRASTGSPLSELVEYQRRRCTSAALVRPRVSRRSTGTATAPASRQPCSATTSSPLGSASATRSPSSTPRSPQRAGDAASRAQTGRRTQTRPARRASTRSARSPATARRPRASATLCQRGRRVSGCGRHSGAVAAARSRDGAGARPAAAGGAP